MNFVSSARAIGNRTKWKGIVVMSSVLSRRPSKVIEYNRMGPTSEHKAPIIPKA